MYLLPGYSVLENIFLNILRISISIFLIPLDKNNCYFLKTFDVSVDVCVLS